MPRSRYLHVLLLTLGLVNIPSQAHGQTPEPRLKAAYVFNFAKFTHWPASADGFNPLTLCLLGRSPVAEALEQDAARVRIGQRPLQVSYVRLPGDLSACDLLYVSELDMSRARRLLGALAEWPILTISDIQGYAQEGGMIELRVVDSRLRFEIDLAAVRAAGLRLEPNLLKLATQVHGVRPAGVP